MPDVVVVGAGFAGLSAAAALVHAGADVLVLEARPGLGGRASSFRDPDTGELVDNGQHVLVGCYHETFRFLTRIGADTSVHRQTTLQVSMIDAHGAATSLVLPALPSPLHLVGGVLAWRALSLVDRLSLLRLVPSLRRAHSPALMEGSASAVPLGTPTTGALQTSARPRAGVDLSENAETVRQWLVRHGQSDCLCELLWEPLALAALNQSIDHAAASYFVAVLARMFGADTSDAALVLPARPLSELYAEPARRWIEARGSAVRTQAPARVVVDNGKVCGVRVRGNLIPSRIVIAAVPWFALRDVFDAPVSELDGLLRSAARTPSSPIVTVNLWVDRPLLDAPLVGLPGRTFQWVFDRRLIVGDDASHLSLVSSGADRVVDMTNDQLAALALRELGTAIPAARTAVVHKASAVRERRATFSLAPGLPPRPSTGTAVTGLFLAGDWIDTGLPATIESAVVSGHGAARSALSKLQNL